MFAIITQAPQNVKGSRPCVLFSDLSFPVGVKAVAIKDPILSPAVGILETTHFRIFGKRDQSVFANSRILSGIL
jgi:hypothetical protein